MQDLHRLCKHELGINCQLGTALELKSRSNVFDFLQGELRLEFNDLFNRARFEQDLRPNLVDTLLFNNVGVKQVDVAKPHIVSQRDSVAVFVKQSENY